MPQLILERDDLLDVLEEPPVYLRKGMDLLDIDACLESVPDEKYPVFVGDNELLPDTLKILQGHEAGGRP